MKQIFNIENQLLTAAGSVAQYLLATKGEDMCVTVGCIFSLSASNFGY